MADTVTPTPAQTAAAVKENASIEAELAANPRDETIPGGRYRRANDPNWYNAEGEPITSDGKKIKPNDGE